MFDRYKILKYLLKKAYGQKRVSYLNLYNYFNVKDDDIRSFLYCLEDAEIRIVEDVINYDIVPIYTVIFYRKFDTLPGIGFYEVFKNRNRQEYIKIAGNISVQDAFEDKKIKHEIFDRALEILKLDLNDRFPDEESVDIFIEEVLLNRDIKITGD